MAMINIESKYDQDQSLVKKMGFPIRCGACDNTKDTFVVKVYGLMDKKKRTCIDFEAKCNDCGYKRIPVGDLDGKSD